MKLLDTTLLIDVLRERPGTEEVLRRFAGEQIFTTRINVFEVLSGVFSLADNTVLNRRLQEAHTLFSKITVLELDQTTALRAAQVAGMLNQQGKPIEAGDCLIAGIALANGVETIVTRNARHFEGIPGLTVETY